MSNDLIQRLLQHDVDPAVIAYARDALATGQTVEAVVRRLRALGLCPPGFFDAYDWQDIVREPHATAQPPRPPPPQGMSSGTKSLLQRLALFIAYALVLIILRAFSGYAHIFAAPLIVAVLLMGVVGLWIALRATVTIWWRSGWWADLVMAAGMVAIIGYLWPSLGIWNNPAGHWLFGQDTPASTASAAPVFAPALAAPHQGTLVPVEENPFAQKPSAWTPPDAASHTPDPTPGGLY